MYYIPGLLLSEVSRGSATYKHAHLFPHCVVPRNTLPAGIITPGGTRR